MKKLFSQFILIILAYSVNAQNRQSLDDAYGVVAHVSRKTIDWNYRNRDFSILKDAGISFVRTDFDWRLLINSNDEYNFEHLDSLMESALNYGINILPILGYNTPKYNPGWKYQAEWLDYVERVVSRYSGLKYYEVWNEENLSSFWKDPSPRDYVSLLKITYEKIKSIDHNKVVVLGGLAGIGLKFLKGIYESGGFDYFDVVNIHYYPLYEEPEFLFSSVKGLLDWMKQNNIMKPIWITETGFPTIHNTEQQQFFFNLPEFVQKVGIRPEETTIGFVVDERFDHTQLNRVYYSELFNDFMQKKIIRFSDLSNINPQKVQVLIPTGSEAFPASYFNSIEKYVKEGGTLVLSYGVPFLYNTDNGKREDVGNKYLKKLHMNTISSMDLILLHKKSLNQQPLGNMVLELNQNNYNQLSFFTTDNLRSGDTFIPLCKAGIDGFMGDVAGIYELNSDLKGNVIVFSSKNNFPISEEIQAQRLPRTFLLSFAHDIEKVFWYNLRAREVDLSNTEDNFGLLHKDLSPKPAFIAYKTLVEMCPNGSTRPSLVQKNGVYLVSWIKPDGTKVYAVWTPIGEKKPKLAIKGEIKSFDHMGRLVNVRDEWVASSEIMYIIGADDVMIQ